MTGIQNVLGWRPPHRHTPLHNQSRPSPPAVVDSPRLSAPRARAECLLPLNQLPARIRFRPLNTHAAPFPSRRVASGPGVLLLYVVRKTQAPIDQLRWWQHLLPASNLKH